MKIIPAAVAGTTAMTLFSYLTSTIKGKQFKEPELLSSLVKRLIPYHVPYRWSKSAFDGWAIHYSVGLIFTLVYDQLWKRTGANPTTTNGLLLGALSGIVGAGVWKTVFSLHPNPPEIAFKKYYGHLIAAHLVFGVFTAISYRAANRIEKNRNTMYL